MPETPIYTINRLLRQFAVHDATADELSMFLLGQNKDASTVSAAIAQLSVGNISNLQFLSAFGYA